MKRTIKLFSLLSLALCMIACGGNDENVSEAMEVVPLTIKDSSIIFKYNFPANIKGVRDVKIYPQVSGRIMKSYVKLGQKVKAGQVLFEIDDIPYLSAFETAKANLESAKAGVENARLTLESKTNLFNQNVISEYQLKLAKNDLLTAQAMQSQAEASLKSAKQNLSFTKVRTMADGQIGPLPYAIGSLVSPSIAEPLTTVSDNSSIYADFSIPENTYLQLNGDNLSEETELSLITNIGQEYKEKGHFHSKSGMISQETGALTIRSIFPNPDNTLLSGGSCQVVFSYPWDGAILIPRTAMKEIQDKLFVFKIENGKLVQTPVLAERFNDKFWVMMPSEDGTFPLKPGDKITSTTNRLKDGIDVVIKNK